MPDWTKSMEQTYEYYIVDPLTWKNKTPLRNVKSSSVTRDLDADTLGSASLDLSEPIGECYIRIYLVTIQNGIKEKHCLGTYLAQTPGSAFNGRVESYTIDAYTPLIELKENPPPIGYYVPKDSNIMNYVYMLTNEQTRAPVVSTITSDTISYNFVSDTSDTWLTYLTDLLTAANYRYGLDELGRIIFLPVQKIASLQPVFTYTDDNSSILLPDISVDRDIFGVPNVVEVIYSNGSKSYYSKVVNDNVNSPVSTVNRGRILTKRVDNPEITGTPSQSVIDEYAKQLLDSLSEVEYTVTYSHGYNNVRIGDCVRLNYKRAGLIDIKAKVISQSISCAKGCTVSETATFTSNIWR